MSDRSSWNMTRIASNRPLPKPITMHGPVGSDDGVSIEMAAFDRACRSCGHHMCSCQRQPTAETWCKHILDHWNAWAKLELARANTYNFPVLTGIEHGQTGGSTYPIWQVTHVNSYLDDLAARVAGLPAQPVGSTDITFTSPSSDNNQFFLELK